METTFKDIVKYCDDNDFNLQKIVTYYEIYDEREEFKPQFEQFENKFGKIKVEECDRTAEHDTAILVVSIGEGNNKIYFGGYGSYASYEGSDYDYLEVKEMQPYQKVITDWRGV
jgi:hypothetical protein